jgi:hypothetical protein
MRSHSLVALSFALAAAGAAAQSGPGAASGADVGFFRPAADPALTTTRPQPPQAPAAPHAPQAPAASETAQMAAAELAATRQEDAVRWADQQMARAEQEAQAARQQQLQAPPSVGAAFTGSTSERDR